MRRRERGGGLSVPALAVVAEEGTGRSIAAYAGRWLALAARTRAVFYSRFRRSAGSPLPGREEADGACPAQQASDASANADTRRREMAAGSARSNGESPRPLDHSAGPNAGSARPNGEFAGPMGDLAGPNKGSARPIGGSARVSRESAGLNAGSARPNAESAGPMGTLGWTQRRVSATQR